MRLFLIYNLRNLLTRKLTTVLTTTGMAFVVFVFSSVQMMAEGLKKTLVDTGSFNNVIVLRKGSQAEIQSAIERQKALIIETFPEIGLSPQGVLLSAKELVVLINLYKKDGDKPSNVVIRGIDKASLLLRDRVRLITGRMPLPGSSEIVVGSAIQKRFKGLSAGERLRFGLRDWTVVGILDGGNTGFNSEIWADIDTLMQTFRRPFYSCIVFRLRNPQDFTSVKERIEGDPRLGLMAKREVEFYREQSEVMARFLRILGNSLAIVFSIGAIIGAMITMYAQVANRIQDIGTLRALGFQKRDILIGFLIESIILSLLGGIAGLFFASLLQFLEVSTLNWQTFSELAFRFNLTAGISLKAIAFSLFMGILGGILPALRASRINIIEALRMG
jgi:putative ABC transport system permease protein